jgi:hypothetical protein
LSVIIYSNEADGNNESLWEATQMKKALLLALIALMLCGMAACSQAVSGEELLPGGPTAPVRQATDADTSSPGATNPDLLTEGQGTANVTVLESDNSGTVIDIYVPDIKEEEITVNNETFQVLAALGCGYTEEVGKPQIPVIRETIGIPDGASVKVAILDASSATYTGYKVYPVQQPELDFAEDGGFVIDEEFYSQDVFYPEETAEVGNPAVWRDISVVSLQVNPVQFNPATGELRVYKHIRVRLEYSGGVAVAKTVEPGYAQMYRSTILNYEFLNIEEKYLNAGDIPVAGAPPAPEGAGLDVTPR